MYAQKPRCPNAQMPRCPDAQMPRCLDAQKPRCPDAQKPRCPDAQMPKCPDARIPRSPGVHQSRTALYINDLKKEISNADLIISHAGAGTILEVLELKKSLITVINQDLMDNHQLELAEKMKSEGYCEMSFVEGLERVIGEVISRMGSFREYKSGSGLDGFRKHLGNVLF